MGGYKVDIKCTWNGLTQINCRPNYCHYSLEHRIVNTRQHVYFVLIAMTNKYVSAVIWNSIFLHL